MRTSKVRFQVTVAEGAFETMLLSSIECFVHGHNSKIPRKPGTQAVEVIGPLWGSVRRTRGKTILRIERAAVSLASQRTYNDCEMPEATQRLLADTMAIIAPGATLLGDFHSHPWKKGLVEARDGRDFTVDDLEVFREDSLIWERSAGNPVILVLTICRLERLMARAPERVRSHMWQFDVGEYRCWLAAAVGFGNRQHTQANDGQVSLDLDLRPFEHRRLKA